MTVHLIKEQVRTTVTTRCGLEIKNFAFGQASLWESDVTCPDCKPQLVVTPKPKKRFVRVPQ